MCFLVICRALGRDCFVKNRSSLVKVISVVDIRDWEEYVRIAETEGDYNTGAYVYQEYAEPTAYSGRYPVIGSWIIGGEAAGIGIRENRMEVTDNLSEFVPHIIG